MSGKIVIARLAVMLLLLPAAACSLVPPDPSAHCCLAVKFVQGGATVTKLAYPANLSPYQSVFAVADDPGGVKFLTLSFSRTVNPCYNPTIGVRYKNGSGVSFEFRPVIAKATTISTPVGPGTGMVLPELAAESALRGPYRCLQDIAKTQEFFPFGTITATATATNYAGATATARLPIQFYYAAPSGGLSSLQHPDQTK